MPKHDAITQDISICIANYNGADCVHACLESVYAQHGNFTLEVVLHDDASSDASLEIVRTDFPQVHILESQKNIGFCISNNRLAEHAHGRYLLLLNNDATLRPESLQRLLAFADDKHDNCILGLPQYSLADKALIDRGYRTDPFLNPVPILDEGTHEAGVATGACLWIPRLVWDAVGGFPAWFESVAEDIFLCQAARLLNYQVIVLDCPGFDHWIGKNFGGGKIVAQGLRTTVRRRKLSERNKTAVMLMCYPWPTLLILLPLHALLLTIEALFLLASGTSRDKVRAIYAPIPRWLWQHRTEIRAGRTSLMRQGCARSRVFFAQTTWLPHKLRMLLRYGKPKLR